MHRKQAITYPLPLTRLRPHRRTVVLHRITGAHHPTTVVTTAGIETSGLPHRRHRLQVPGEVAQQAVMACHPFLHRRQGVDGTRRPQAAVEGHKITGGLGFPAARKTSMMAPTRPCHLLHPHFVAGNAVAPLVAGRMPLAPTLASEGDLGLVVSMEAQLSKAAQPGAVVATLALAMVGALTQLAAAGRHCPPDSQ